MWRPGLMTCAAQHERQRGCRGSPTPPRMRIAALSCRILGSRFCAGVGDGRETRSRRGGRDLRRGDFRFRGDAGRFPVAARAGRGRAAARVCRRWGSRARSSRAGITRGCGTRPRTCSRSRGAWRSCGGRWGRSTTAGMPTRFRAGRRGRGRSELLRGIAAEGSRAGMVSNIGRRALGEALARFGYERWLRPVVSRDEVTWMKPRAEGIRAGARGVGRGSRQEVLFVGDSRADVMGARAAGVAVAIVRGGECDEAAFAGDPPELHGVEAGRAVGADRSQLDDEIDLVAVAEGDRVVDEPDALGRDPVPAYLGQRRRDLGRQARRVAQEREFRAVQVPRPRLLFAGETGRAPFQLYALDLASIPRSPPGSSPRRAGSAPCCGSACSPRRTGNKAPSPGAT